MLVFFRLTFLVLPLFIAACEDMDFLAEKKTPLAGTRRELFPSGVPGVNYNQPPPQPSNSNIDVNTEVPKNLLVDEPVKPPPAPEEPKAKAAKQQPRSAPPPRSTARNNQPEDPWAGAR
jgi:hypothetical protein